MEVGIVVGAIAALGIAGAFVWQGVSWLRSPERLREKQARAIAVTPLEEVVAGRRVKVKAFLEIVVPPLVAPISGRKCAGWSIELLERDGEDLTVVHASSELGDFGLRSPSGALALVRRLPATAYTINREVVEGPIEDAEAFCQARGIEPRPRQTYREAVLRAAVEVTVVGVAEREPDPRAQASYREAAPTRVVFSQPPVWVSHE